MYKEMSSVAINTQIVILAGGKGTRLSLINNLVPKALTPVNGLPIIEHQLRFCMMQGFNRFLFVLSYKSDYIIEYFKNKSFLGIDIQFYIEKYPKGTGGALLSCLPLLDDNFIVLYGDTFLTIDLNRFIKKYFSYCSKDYQPYGQIFVHPNNHPSDSDLVEFNFDNKLISLHGYPHDSGLEHKNLVNAVCYFLTKKLLIKVSKRLKCESIIDIAKDIFPIAIKDKLDIYGYQSSEYIKDMGTPNRLSLLEDILASGKLTNLSPGNSREVIFLDRDGCINKEKGRITNKDDLELIEGSAKAITTFNESALPVFCVTNQPSVARGDISENDLNKIHSRLDSLLGKHGAYLDKIYFCPHHTDKGFLGEIAEYKINCNCRKPKPGLLFQAALENDIDFSKSWFIGDTTTDISAAKSCGLKSILLKTGYAGKDLKENVKPDYIFQNLEEASKWITHYYYQFKVSIYNILPKLLENKLILVTGLDSINQSNYSQVVKDVIESIGKKCHLINTLTWSSNVKVNDISKQKYCYFDNNSIIDFFENYLNCKFPIYQRHKLSLDNNHEIYLNDVIYNNSVVILEGDFSQDIINNYSEFFVYIFLKHKYEKNHIYSSENKKSKFDSRSELSKKKQKIDLTIADSSFDIEFYY